MTETESHSIMQPSLATQRDGTFPPRYYYFVIVTICYVQKKEQMERLFFNKDGYRDPGPPPDYS